MKRNTMETMERSRSPKTCIYIKFCISLFLPVCMLSLYTLSVMCMRKLKVYKISYYELYMKDAAGRI